MQISHLGPSDLDAGHPPHRPLLAEQFSVLIGLALITGVALAFASLASWHVSDPSFSHASAHPVQNILGFPGAAFADLAMQFFGLGASIALISPALWAWWKLLRRPISSLRVRLFLWPVSVIIACAAFSTLTIPESWPLPVGLGGVSGDKAVALLAAIGLPVSQGVLSWVFAALLWTAALILVLLSAGLLRLNNAGSAEFPTDDLDELAGEVEDDRPSWALGALTHLYLSFRYRWASRRDELPAAEQLMDKPGLLERLRTAYDRITSPPDDGLQEFGRATADPGLSTAEYADTEFTGPDYGETVHNPHHEAEIAERIEAEWGPQDPPAPEVVAAATAVAPPDANAQRVQPMAPPPKPSARVSREAQPSLLSGGEFELPSLHFLSDVPERDPKSTLSEEALEQNARLLEGVLEDFGVKGEIIHVRPGPVVTLYELEPAPGIKSSRVIGLADDIARSMSAIAARVAVVPGRNAIGIELPNQNRETVFLREILASKTYDSTKAKLPIILGKTIGGEPTIADLAKMPHLLVAGTTGSGKSVAINTMILSILYRLSPEKVKMIMIDPKMLELSIYDGIPHLLTPVVTDPKKAVVALKWTVREMEERYKKMSKLGVRNIDGYNTRITQAARKKETLTRTIQTGYDKDTGEAIYETEELELESMPYIVVVIDEMADLMMVAGKDIEGTIQRLAQMARAAGIHVIMATQRPSVDVITGTIKANFPTRISFQVTSKIDSRTILGEQGAEQLLGMGDMLYMAGGGRIQRVHGPFVDDHEVETVVNHLKTQGVPQYLDSVTEDTEEEEAGSGDVSGLADSNDIYDQAVAIVLKDRKVSTSYIQRRLSIGYNRAASLIERMEQEGLISAANHAGKREILVPGEDETI